MYNKHMYDPKYKLRTLAYRNEGHTLAQTSSVFGISINTIRKWEKQLREEGNFNRRPIKRRFRKIDPQKLKDYVAENPDAYLREIAANFDCWPNAVRKALHRLKITRKKRPHATTNKTRKR